jgi:hypothetical protein
MELLKMEGVEHLKLDLTVKVGVKRTNTREKTKTFQPVREREVSEEEIKDLVSGTDWSHTGEVDVQDFRATDRIQKTSRKEL